MPAPTGCNGCAEPLDPASDRLDMLDLHLLGCELLPYAPQCGKPLLQLAAAYPQFLQVNDLGGVGINQRLDLSTDLELWMLEILPPGTALIGHEPATLRSGQGLIEHRRLGPATCTIWRSFSR